jgi:hypothetical protein
MLKLISGAFDGGTKYSDICITSDIEEMTHQPQATTD